MQTYGLQKESFVDKVSEVPDIAGKDIDKVLRAGIERLASGDRCCVDDRCRVDYTANNDGTVEDL